MVALAIEMMTSRMRRTWFEKMKMWPRAYETQIRDGYSLIVGRGLSPEASQAAARAMVKRMSPTASEEREVGEAGSSSASSNALDPEMQPQLAPMSHMSAFIYFKSFAEVRSSETSQ